jgi:hypothetical protein
MKGWMLGDTQAAEGAMSDLYDQDILVWSERQADLLRRLDSGLPTNERPDWTNIIEEIEDVGRSELHAVESLLAQALRHWLKAEAWPASRDASTWRSDSIDFRAQARRRYTPSMRQRIDLAEIYADALEALPETMDGIVPGPVPAQCPLTLDELLTPRRSGVNVAR